MPSYRKTWLLVAPLMIAALVVDDAALSLVFSLVAFAVACAGLALFLRERRAPR